MKCPRCGKSIDEKADMCVYCGVILHKDKVQYKSHRFKRKIRNMECKVVIAVILSVILLSIVLVSYIIHNNKYARGVSYLENGDYIIASYIFEEMGQYRCSEEYLCECKYQIAIQKLEENEDLSNIESVVEEFELLNDYKDSESYLKKAEAEYGFQLYRYGEFDAAIKYLEKTKDIQDRTELVDKCKFMKRYQGVWMRSDKSYALDINGWGVNEVYFENRNGKPTANKIIDRGTAEVDLDNEEIKYMIPAGSIYLKLIDNNMMETCIADYDKKYDSSYYEEFSDMLIQKLEKRDEGYVVLSDPKIGMTKEEVLESSWGSPESKVKSRYSWENSETWYYSNLRSLYFDGNELMMIMDANK